MEIKEVLDLAEVAYYSISEDGKQVCRVNSKPVPALWEAFPGCTMAAHGEQGKYLGSCKIPLPVYDDKEESALLPPNTTTEEEGVSAILREAAGFCRVQSAMLENTIGAIVRTNEDCLDVLREAVTVRRDDEEAGIPAHLLQTVPQFGLLPPAAAGMVVPIVTALVPLLVKVLQSKYPELFQKAGDAMEVLDKVKDLIEPVSPPIPPVQSE